MIWLGYSRLSLVIRSVHTLGMDWLNDMVGIWQAITGHQVCAHSGHGLVKGYGWDIAGYHWSSGLCTLWAWTG